MAGTPDNAHVWTGADIYVAPVGTTGPTDLATALNVAFKPVGLLGTDGLTEGRDEDVNDFFAWGGILVRSVRSKHKRTFKFVTLEDNKVTFDLQNPGSTIGAAAAGITTRTIKAPAPNPKAFVFQLNDGSAATRRRAVPKAEVTEVGEVTYIEDDLAVVELTVTVYPASDGTLYFDIGNEAAFA